MSRAIKAVIWDVDGVLVDTADMFRISRERTLDSLGLQPDQVTQAMGVWDRLFWHFDMSDKAGILRATIQELGLEVISDEQIESALAIYKQSWTNDIAAVPGIPELVTELTQRGISQAIVSNGEPDWQMHKLTTAGMTKYFPAEHIIIAESSSPEAKPNPNGILQACRILGVDPAEAAYVGDRITDVIAANLAGVVSVFYACIPKAPEVHWPPAEGAINLEKPQHTVETVADLKKLLLN